jgi:hypothetical protein
MLGWSQHNEMAAADVAEADWRKSVSYGGVADRRAL